MDLLPYQFCNSIDGCTLNFEVLPEFVISDREIAEAAFINHCLLLDALMGQNITPRKLSCLLLYVCAPVC
jgi:hypothetical protein